MTEPVTTATGLTYEDIDAGTGAVAQAGQRATVHYTGWLKSGQKFDSSKDREHLDERAFQHGEHPRLVVEARPDP